MGQKTKFIGKKRRSVVRILASLIPDYLWEYFMPTVPRMYFSPNLVDNNISKVVNLDDSNASFCTFKSYIHNRKPQEIFNSTPKRNGGLDNNKIRALEEELDEIKRQIAMLMERQSEQFHCSEYGTLVAPSEQLQRSHISPPAPPPPPPPPPPLPSTPLTNFNSPLKLENRKKKIVPPSNNGFLYGKELLKELKKVQLKKVEKSPGGGPLKKAKNDPGDFLEAALKKRFGCVRNSPNSSKESVSLNQNESFGCENHELQKSVTIVVT